MNIDWIQDDHRLAPCPMCGPGGSIVQGIKDYYGKWHIACGRCGLHSGFRSDNDFEKLLTHWNTRRAPMTDRLPYTCMPCGWSTDSETSMSDHLANDHRPEVVPAQRPARLTYLEAAEKAKALEIKVRKEAQERYPGDASPMQAAYVIASLREALTLSLCGLPVGRGRGGLTFGEGLLPGGSEP